MLPLRGWCSGQCACPSFQKPGCPRGVCIYCQLVPASRQSLATRPHPHTFHCLRVCLWWGGWRMVAHSLYLAPLLPVFWWEDCTLLFPLPHLYTTFIIFNCCSDIVKVGDSRKKLDSIVLCYRRLWVECHCNCSSNHKVCAEVCYHKICDNIRPWNLSSHLTTHAIDFYAYYLYFIMCNTRHIALRKQWVSQSESSASG